MVAKSPVRVAAIQNNPILNKNRSFRAKEESGRRVGGESDESGRRVGGECKESGRRMGEECKESNEEISKLSKKEAGWILGGSTGVGLVAGALIGAGPVSAMAGAAYAASYGASGRRVGGEWEESARRVGGGRQGGVEGMYEPER